MLSVKTQPSIRCNTEEIKSLTVSTIVSELLSSSLKLSGVIHPYAAREKGQKQASLISVSR